MLTEAEAQEVALRRAVLRLIRRSTPQARSIAWGVPEVGAEQGPAARLPVRGASAGLPILSRLGARDSQGSLAVPARVLAHCSQRFLAPTSVRYSLTLVLVAEGLEAQLLAPERQPEVQEAHQEAEPVAARESEPQGTPAPVALVETERSG